MPQVVPESRLRLIVTITAPGFEEIAPDKVTEDSRVIEFGDADKVILVDGLMNVVRVIDVVVLVDV
jgi:hypothetical protein